MTRPVQTATAMLLTLLLAGCTAAAGPPAAGPPAPTTMRVTAVAPPAPTVTSRTPPAPETSAHPASPSGSGPLVRTSPAASSPQKPTWPAPSSTPAATWSSAPKTTSQMSSTQAAPRTGPTTGGRAQTVTLTPRVVGAVPDLTAAPARPRLTPQPDDFTTPESVVAAYLAAWCYQPLNKPANQNIATAAAWVTKAGWDSDVRQALTNQQWSARVQSGLTTLCGPPKVVISPDAPRGEALVWVSVTARQAYVDDSGRIIRQQNISETRRVLRADDGRWLVDVQVAAG